MLNITNYQGNANQNHNEILSYHNYNGSYQKRQEQILARMQRKGQLSYTAGEDIN
jgi:3-dehydroquinate dehydratase